MTTQTGKIHSSNYPNMYDNHDDCAWLIEVDRNHVVQLSFEVVNVSAFDPFDVYRVTHQVEPNLQLTSKRNFCFEGKGRFGST